MGDGFLTLGGLRAWWFGRSRPEFVEFAISLDGAERTRAILNLPKIFATPKEPTGSPIMTSLMKTLALRHLICPLVRARRIAQSVAQSMS
jgi:hypothetical protein